MRLAYNIHAHILEISGELDQALIFLNKSLLLSREMSNSVFIAMDISNLFSFFMRRFSLSSDKQFLERAREMNHNLKELEFSQENETITRLSKLSDAMLLKLGSVRSKAKAIDLIEEQITQYPKGFDMFYRTVDRTINLKVHLIDLYMQDLEFDHTGESKRQIDILIEEISESPLFKNPNTIAEYSDFQILVARYKYYVEGDINGAFSLLEELASYTEHFGLQSVKKKIEFHISHLRQEVSKWKNVDISIQNRIKQSQIKDYIKKALETSRQDLTLD